MYRRASLKYDAVVQWSMLHLSSSVANLPTLGNWFSQFDQQPLPRSIWLEANAAIIEGYTNAVKHAHRHLSEQSPILINALLTQDFLGFEIWDQGLAFDFEHELLILRSLKEDPLFNPLDREAHWGGLIFLKLIEKFNWEITYVRYQDLRNCLMAKVNFRERLMSS